MPVDFIENLNLVRLLLGILACYRITGFLVFDNGPWNLFFKLRVWAGVFDTNDRGEPNSNLGKLLSCPYCTGFWVAIAVAVLVIFPTWPGDIFLLILGIAGGQAALEGR